MRTKISHNTGPIDYPVGQYMKQAIAYVDCVVDPITEELGTKPINLWARGSSGSILSALLVSKLKNDCTIFHVKKTGEKAHSNNSLDLTKDHLTNANIIIDDIICSGKTMQAIWEVASLYINHIDILCVSGMYRGDWPTGFIPKLLITNREGVETLPSFLLEKKVVPIKS